MADRSLFWADQVAADVLAKWTVPVYRAEMGIGASGIPHVGSVGDGVRSYAVALGIADAGKKSELLAFADDRDGLRKVPSGFPQSLSREIGKPVSTIPDPFGCHSSFALHISSLLTDAFGKLGVAFTLRRADEEYRKGTFDKEVIHLLTHAREAGEIIRRVTGSEKFVHQLPFLPVCRSCGRLYTTRAIEFLPKEKKVVYACDQEFIGKAGIEQIPVKGCGLEGEAGIREGKLAWKVEFAARWRALDVHYEAYGKDILDSVRCNDAICRELLGREPPVHSFYELFTERGGQKISKSKGNVFTPQRWLEYASPQSLRLLFLKRLGTSRVVDLDAIPALMDEVDSLERLYFGLEQETNKKDVAHRRRLFEYMHLLQPPGRAGLMIPYTMVSHLAASLPIEGREAIIKDILLASGRQGKLSPVAEQELDRRIRYASAWASAGAAGTRRQMDITLDTAEKKALGQLAAAITSPLSADDIQNAIFSIAKERGLQTQRLFRLVYQITIGMDRGPKAGHLIELLGRDRVRKLIKQRL